jgi:hypothetical protein
MPNTASVKGATAAIAAFVLACGASPFAGPRSFFDSPTLQNTVDTPASARQVIDRYCVTCHNQRLKTAGLMFDQLNLEQIAQSPDIWERVIRKLRTSTMPPPGAPRPDKTSSDVLASWLEASLDRSAAANPHPGRPAIHRLNRFEYANAIRDLFGIDVDVRSLLPADDAAYGFDNIADLLSLSSTRLERYLAAARAISHTVVGDPSIQPSIERYDVHKLLSQDGRMSEDLPFGSQGGIAVRHYFPLNAQYVLKLKLKRSPSPGDVARVDARIDGQRLVLASGAKPSPEAGAEDQAGAAPASSLETRIRVSAGTKLLTVTFPEARVATAGIAPVRLPQEDVSRATPLSLSWLELDGPYDVESPGDSPTRRRVFVCRPSAGRDEEPCARRIFAAVARHAYRRPVSDDDLKPLMAFYKTGRAKRGFDSAIAQGLERVLVDPDFLFRLERAPRGVENQRVFRISDIDLASRLSFFLWSSIPDEELLGLAERGQLHDQRILEAQVRRMLSDERASALVDNFATQWLFLRNLDAARPNLSAAPEFDESLRQAFAQETELFLTSQLHEDRSVTDLLTADYTFLNERLARHYGIPNVYGTHFRRVALPEDSPRRGLLGQGSILTVTSYANRTSVVLRGKWLLENLLGAPPPPPPANVPALEESAEGTTSASVRQLMERHRRNPACASCHARMDPLGFALEHFDPVGRWRTDDAGVPVDAAGVLPDGVRFDNMPQLRAVLLARREQIVGTVAEKLLTYALGRGLESYDMPAVRTVVREAATNDYRWSALIMAIVRSTPFQMRSADR